MKTLTVRLPDLLARRIEEEAPARRMSKSDIVRERLDQPQPVPGKGGGGMRELIGDLIGSVKDDGLPAEGESLRHILEESWQARVPDQPPRFRSPHKQKIADLIRAKKLRR